MESRERLAYWNKQIKAAERALEYARQQKHAAQVELGVIAAKELVEPTHEA